MIKTGWSALAGARLGFARQFHYSCTVYKKKNAGGGGKTASKSSGGGSSGAVEVEAEVKQLDLDGLKRQLESSKTMFADKIKEIKGGSLDQKKFHGLPIEIGDGEVPLGQLATIAARGNKISIVAYDPKHVKNIRSAIVGKLGVPAEESNTDKQTLSVSLGGSSKDQKAEIAKQLKAEFEHFKSSASRHSIASVRTKYMNTVKKSKAGKSENEQKKETKQVEDLVKTYQTAFQDMLRKAAQ